jgi:hypothetical protein
MMGSLTGYGHLQGHLLKLGLVDNPWYVQWKQASEKVSCVLCDCNAMAVLRFRNLGHNFLTSGDFADISVCKVSALCLNCGAAECLCEGLRKNQKWCVDSCPNLFQLRIHQLQCKVQFHPVASHPIRIKLELAFPKYKP